MGRRLERYVPLRDPLALILRLILDHEPIADVCDVDLAPLEVWVARFEVRFHVIEEFFDAEGVRFEFDPRPVAEAEAERPPRGCRQGTRRLKAAPVPHNLVETLLMFPAVPRAETANTVSPQFGGPRVLPAVLVDSGERRQRALGLGFLSRRGHIAIDVEKVELVGKREPLDAGGQASDRFKVFQRLDGVGTIRLGLCLLFPVEKTPEVAQRLHAELLVEKVGQRQRRRDPCPPETRRRLGPAPTASALRPILPRRSEPVPDKKPGFRRHRPGHRSSFRRSRLSHCNRGASTGR